MKRSLAATIILGLVLVGIAHADINGVWGYTRNTTVIPTEPIICNVQAESEAGDSPIVQSYYVTEDITQYQIGAANLFWGRTYDDVHAWIGGMEGYNANPFTWTGGEVTRHVNLNNCK